jgi:hypothetical protein
MSESEITACPFAAEVENAAHETYNKTCAVGVREETAAAYAQASLELRRIVRRHAAACAICQTQEGHLHAATSALQALGQSEVA